MNYKIGDILILENDEKYCIIKKIDKYFLLLKSREPLDILVVQIENDNIKIIKDNDIILKVLCF